MKKLKLLTKILGVTLVFLIFGAVINGITFASPSSEYIAQPPEVTTHPPTNITSTSAILHGYLDSLHELSSSTAAAIEPVGTTTSSEEDQDDYDDIPILQWVDPEGRQPLSYEEYIKTLPPVRPLVVEQSYTTPLSPMEGLDQQLPLVLVIVNSLIKPYIQESLDQYVLDLQNEGYSATVCTAIGGNSSELRGVLQDELPNGLVGATLIGDLPVPWYEMYDDFGDQYSQFPIDLYYMDLDGTWVDSDINGLYDEHSDGEGTRVPEIWIGRLTASTLTANIEEEAAILQNYFAKNHAYRTGGLLLNKRALVYVDDDWIPWADQWSDDVGLAYDTRTLVKDGVTTNASDYMDRLTHNYEWVHVCAHSSPWLHSFKIGDEWTGGTVNNTDIQTIDPAALFYNLFACSNARYVEEDYMGGCYVFADTYGLAAVGSTKTGSMLDFHKFYAPVGQYRSLGESFKEWFIGVGPYDLLERQWFYGMTLLGDPTLALQPEVDISVMLQGGSRPPEGWEVPITIKFFNPGADVMTGSPLYEFSLNTTKSDGMAISQCTVAPGTYDVTVVSEHTLINVKRNVVISTPSTAVDMGTLLEGNANDDIIINISDFGILAVSYMKTEGEPGYDARADFDRNGIINISDFGLLAVNYMEMCPIDVSG